MISDPRPQLLQAPFSAEQAAVQQRLWSRHLGLDVQMSNSLGMGLTLIPPGEFQMGTAIPPDEWVRMFAAFSAQEFWFEDELPAHRVRITQPVSVGTHLVRHGDFARFVAETGYVTDAEKNRDLGWGYDAARHEFCRDGRFSWRCTGWDRDDRHPVVNVTYNDAIAFIDWLSRIESRPYRLQSEAEWEYACRAGTTSLFYNGDSLERLPEIANIADITFRKKFTDHATIDGCDGYVFTSPVQQFVPNAFGLYDMLGNVGEWQADWYHGDYYANSPIDDPCALVPAQFRVCRGGSWMVDPAHARVMHRYGFKPDECSFTIGFRVAATL